MNSELDTNLDVALQILVTDYVGRLRETLKAAAVEGGRGITPEQYTILMALVHHGQGQSVMALAEHIAAPHANVSRTLDRLEGKGLVFRGQSRDDGRRVVIHLTLEGKKAVGKLREVSKKVQMKIWGRYSEEEKRLLLELMTKGR